MIKSLFGNNVNEYYLRKIRAIGAKRAERIDAIRTKEEAAAYVREVKEKIERIFRFPERTPLDPVVTAKKGLGTYIMENVVYYSRPALPVTANFYYPKERKGKIPGVLFLCGHANEGKGSDTYRTAAINLMLKGFAVLLVDPAEQGERKQYPDHPDCGNLCEVHNLMGKQMSLVDEWFGAWRTWDAVRGLDYLQTRSEVDENILAVTGNSGGGTLTAFTAAVDPRPAAVAPSCYITTWQHNVENELPADIEQMPPGIWAEGLEMADLLLAQAPRNILILGQKDDFFDARGTKEAFDSVRKINDLLGGETELFIGPCSHGYHKENRQAMYGFFTGKFFSAPDPAEDDTLLLPPQEETWAIGNDLRNIPGQRFLRSFYMEKAEMLARSRPALDLKQTRAILTSLLNMPAVTVPHYRILRPRNVNEIFAARFALETEGNEVTAVLHHVTGEGFNILDPEKGKALLYIPDQDSLTEYANRVMPADSAFFALDIRGIGEMMPSGCDQTPLHDFYESYGFDYHYTACSLMASEPMIGRRVYDILCAVELLHHAGFREITLEGHGPGAIAALIAAVLSDRITGVRLTGLIESYETILKTPVTRFPLSCMIPGILQHTDIPELKRLIAAKIIHD